MMWPKSLIVVMVIVSGMSLFTQPAWASEAEIVAALSADDSVAAKTWTDAHGIASAGPSTPCDADLLTGSWAVVLKSTNGSGEAVGKECWAGCKVMVGPGGIIEEGTYIDCEGNKSKIIGGRFTISPGCTVKAKIVTPEETLYAIPGGQIIGDKLWLGLVTKAPADELQQGEMERALGYQREDIRGVLHRILHEKQLKTSEF